MALKGTIHIPGDKSISHRAVMIGSLAKGKTTVDNFLMGADCLSTIDCFRLLGVDIEVSDNKVVINGLGWGNLKESHTVLPVGNSGTTTRLISGILAAHPIYSVLSGDDSLNNRTMKRVIDPLKSMGAQVYGRKNNTYAPLTIIGSNKLKAINYNSPIASAQVKSCLIFAGLGADGITTVTEPVKSRDHTELMLSSFGAKLDVEGNAVKVHPNPILTGQNITVPGDISSAAFFIAAASIVPGSELTLKNVGMNPTRTGILKAFEMMGGQYEVLREYKAGAEPVADILVKYCKLKGAKIAGSIVPELIDEVPILALMASQAEGESVFDDLGELRVKESDRIKAIVTNFSAMGIDIKETERGFIIKGSNKIKGAKFTTYHDHRMSMVAQVAQLLTTEKIDIDDYECAAVSFPEFTKVLRSVVAG
jgi:3-phosphoshikimate 1-carboxyvinyltransferase